MKFTIVGITDKPHPDFPKEVQEIIRRGKVFSGGRRHRDLVADLLPDAVVWIDITVPISSVFEQYRQFDEIIVFASGDPLFFGFANTICREMPDAEIRTFPAFNSLQLLAHRLVIPYHDMHIVSLTGRPWHSFDRAIIEGHGKIGVLTDKEHTPGAVAARMLEYGYLNYRMYVGEHLGNPEKEQVKAFSLEEAKNTSFSLPNCLILIGTHQLRWGIPDQEFTLLDHRERMITKMPIRLLSLQALDLPSRHTLWDIGFCTGSVSIEAKLQFPHLHIEAFEIRQECENIINENSRKFGALGINVHIGDFLTADCSAMNPPDAVFIGGHGGLLPDIMRKAAEYLTESGCIVMNSVTTESRHLFYESCAALGLIPQPPLHIQLNEYNPIDILKCIPQ
jgi:precorrin-6Y C5,15-methyltransferase (decarboxylating)